MASPDLDARWQALTVAAMPALAAERGWPVRFDQCFQRILPDNAVDGPWRAHIAPPAYANATDAQLARAIALGKAALTGATDLATLNARSLAWRGKGGRPG